MKLDYRRDLEKAAKQMILVHRVDTLIRMILRTILKSLKIDHAGLLLYDKERDEYVVTVSRSRGGMKIPPGFAKIKKSNPLIRYFTDPGLKSFSREYLLADEIEKLFRSKKARASRKLKKFLESIKFQLSLYNIQACVPGFFRNELICVFFLGKKSNRKKLTAEELGFLSVLSSDAVMAIQNAWFFQDIDNQLKRNRRLFLQTILALASAIEAKDEYTSGHTSRVARYTLLLAEELWRMNKISRPGRGKFIEDLKTAALLHDIGKIGIREAVLNKKSILTPNEQKEMARHPLLGSSILKRIDELQDPIQGVKYHHERYDGKGYPEGLKGNKIPLIAQIIALADTFDAMTTDRPYRKGLAKQKAARVIRENKGKQFSPLAVEAFLRVYKKGRV